MRRRLLPLGAAVLLAVGALELALAGAAAAATCASCKADAARRFFAASRVIDCAQPIPAAAFGRLRRAIRNCEQRYACAGGEGSDAVLGELEATVQSIEASVCSAACAGDGCSGTPIDPTAVRGPAGRSPAAVSPASAPSLDDVDRFCALHPGYDAAPPLLALPESASLPEWCSESDAYAGLVAACGPPRVVLVDAAATVGPGEGSAERPFATIGEALADCRGACHVLVAPGTYRESVQVPPCTFIEGGVAITGGSVVAGAARPRIEGQLRASGDATVLARLDVVDAYGALVTDDDVLVSDSVLRGGYEAGSSGWSAIGPRICRSNLAGGYGGFDIAWHSSRLWLAGSAVSACYEGMALSWGSSDLKVLGSVLYGGHEAVGTSWGSFGVEVTGNRLASAFAAVSVHLAPDENEVMPASFDVRVTGNRIVSGTLPENDPSLGIVVRDNVLE